MKKRNPNSNLEKSNGLTVKQLLEFVTQLCSEEKYDSVEGHWTFKSGGDCGRCTDGAMKVALKFDGRVVGYNSLDNPSAAIGYEYCGGHDFAIISSRFLVDYWAFRIAQLIATPVFDLGDRSDHELVRSLYGNEKTWENVSLITEIGFYDDTP